LVYPFVTVAFRVGAPEVGFIERSRRASDDSRGRKDGGTVVVAFVGTHARTHARTNERTNEESVACASWRFFSLTTFVA
jgi:hypothetical protein